MQPSTGKIIECIRGVLAQHILPECKSQNASAQLALVDVALLELLDRADGRRRHLLTFYRQHQKMIERGRRLLATADPPIAEGPRTAEFAATPTLAGMVSWEQAESASEPLRAELVDLIEALIERLRISPDGQWATQARTWVEEAIRDEVDRSTQTRGEDKAMAVRLDVLPDPDSSRLHPYFRDRLAIPVHASFALDQLSGGFSRETLLLKAKIADQKEKSWILRKEKGIGLMDGISLPLRNEYTIVKFAFDQGLPVARPLWFESDPALIGGAFAVVERVPGAQLGTPVKVVGVTDSIIRQVAHTLARLHTTRWQERSQDIRAALKFPSEGRLTLKRVFEITIGRWRDFFDRKRISPSPAIAAALRWLSINVPDKDAEASLVHGDVGFHNMLFDDGALTGLLDWELADLGDPARDLVQLRRLIHPYVVWPQFISWYREGGGADVAEDVMRYYEVFSAMTCVITMLVALESQFELQSPPQIKFLELGLGFMPYFFKEFGVNAAPIWT
jgi:aminoglycoside phosphotransferase (APT) family kinase protein